MAVATRLRGTKGIKKAAASAKMAAVQKKGEPVKEVEQVAPEAEVPEQKEQQVPAEAAAEPAPAAQKEEQQQEDACGLQSNESLTDAEAMEALAPESAVEEELRLQKEREEEEAKRKASNPLMQGLKTAALEQSRFAALEHLLRQSEAYTSFLAEQIKDIEARTEAEAAARLAAAEAAQRSKAEGSEEEGAAAGPSGKAGAKGKGGKGGAKAGAAAKGKGTKRGRGGKAKEAEEEEEEPAEAEAEASEGERGSKAPRLALNPTQQLLPLMNVELRDYQLKGVKWLISLFHNGVNGILADQMGLGKTVQTIGFLSFLKSKGIHGPFMIVAPLSTLPNWVNEFQRFLPSCPPLLYHGSKQEREAMRATQLRLDPRKPAPSDYPVLITSFEIVIADAKFLSKTRFKYIVVDEGHRLKNFECRLIRELKTIPAENKLLLSGTPLQNNLSELWSLLNFLMPEVFSNMADFEAWFDFSSVVGQEGADQEILAAEQRNQVVSKLHSILKPFVLRRLKSDVEIALPRKMEVVLYAGMTEEQRQLNEQLRKGELMDEMKKLADREGTSSSAAGSLKNVLMQMRKICNHPDLVTSAFTNDINFPPPETLIQQCGKMALLDRMLRKLQAQGRKVLIFSQMTKMLDLIESCLDQQGHRVCRIDGSIPWQERQRNIKDFNEDPKTWVFLLSTRAGGLGINLTSADTVIIYDSDWNPHQDMQAMDRCHRIGQTKPVLVFRLATAHSVEGKMLRRAANKMALERLVIKKGAFKELAGTEADEAGKAGSSSLSASELLEVLKGDYKMDDIPQSGVVSEEMLDTLLDRNHLEASSEPPFPGSGVGYEVVQVMESGASLLKDINK